jgi:hypothetical protein
LRGSGRAKTIALLLTLEGSALDVAFDSVYEMPPRSRLPRPQPHQFPHDA